MYSTLRCGHLNLVQVVNPVVLVKKRHLCIVSSVFLAVGDVCWGSRGSWLGGEYLFRSSELN